MKTLTALAGITLATAVVAQNIATFPSDHANIPNGANFSANLPLALGISRIQSEYDAWDMTVPNGHLITAIGFRQDGNNAAPGYDLQLEVRMGAAVADHAGISTTFDNNYFGSPVTVFGPALFTLPNLTAATSGQMILLNLTTPFPYDSSHDLLIEFRIAANSNGNLAWNYYLDLANFRSPVVAGPQGCLHSGNSRAHLASVATGAAVGGFWMLNMSSAPLNSFGFLLASVGTPLVTPYSLQALLPGIAPSCMGQLDYNVPWFLSSFATGTSGNYGWSIPVPNNRALWNDVFVSTQVVMIDLASPGSFIVSNGDQVQIGVDPGETLIYARGSATALTGLAMRNYGIVTFFQYN